MKIIHADVIPIKCAFKRCPKESTVALKIILLPYLQHLLGPKNNTLNFKMGTVGRKIFLFCLNIYMRMI